MVLSGTLLDPTDIGLVAKEKINLLTGSIIPLRWNSVLLRWGFFWYRIFTVRSYKEILLPHGSTLVLRNFCWFPLLLGWCKLFLTRWGDILSDGMCAQFRVPPLPELCTKRSNDAAESLVVGNLKARKSRRVRNYRKQILTKSGVSSIVWKRRSLLRSLLGYSRDALLVNRLGTET